MKRLISSLLIITMVLSTMVFTPSAVEAKAFKHEYKATMNGIKVKWTKKKKASKYVVYRAKMKKETSEPAKKKYKKVGKTSKRSFYDKKVKKNTLYAYNVKALNKKGKQVGSTYERSPECEAKGLMKPYLDNIGYGEDYTNDAKHLYIRAWGWYGIIPKKLKCQIYRKLKGTKKFKKIKTTKFGAEFCDKTVKPGKTYIYKARKYYKKGKKKYYSPFSDTLTLGAYDDYVGFDIETLTPAGVYNEDSLEVVFTIKKNNKYSGKAYILNNAVDYLVTPKSNFEDRRVYNIYIAEYSVDNKNWKDISGEGLLLPYNKTYYIKAVLSRGSEENIMFGGNDKVNYSESLIDAEGGLIDYDGSGSGYTSSHIDFLKGYGSGYQEWD